MKRLVATIGFAAVIAVAAVLMKFGLSVGVAATVALVLVGTVAFLAGLRRNTTVMAGGIALWVLAAGVMLVAAAHAIGPSGPAVIWSALGLLALAAVAVPTVRSGRASRRNTGERLAGRARVAAANGWTYRERESVPATRVPEHPAGTGNPIGRGNYNPRWRLREALGVVEGRLDGFAFRVFDIGRPTVLGLTWMAPATVMVVELPLTLPYIAARSESRGPAGTTRLRGIPPTRPYTTDEDCSRVLFTPEMIRRLGELRWWVAGDRLWLVVFPGPLTDLEWLLNKAADLLGTIPWDDLRRYLATGPRATTDGADACS